MTSTVDSKDELATGAATGGGTIDGLPRVPYAWRPYDEEAAGP